MGAVLLQAGLDQRQHLGELREDEDAAAFLDQFGQHLVHQISRFGRFLDVLRGFLFEQLRMAADLAEFEQRIEHDDLRAIQTVHGDGLAHAFVHRSADRLIQIGLFLAEGDVVQDFGLWRQFLGHGILRAAQHERLNARAELLLAIGIGIALNRIAVVLTKRVRIAQQTGHEELEEAPQLAEMVFHRRAGEAEAVFGLQTAANLRGEAFRVLDVLRLVERDDVPLLFAHHFGIAHEQRKARHDEIILLQELEIALPALPVHQQQAERRCELDRFVDPVPQNARGGHDEAGAVHAAAFLLDEDVRERLQRFAQAHVIGQNAVQAEFAQELHPRGTFALIIAQTGLQRLRRLDERDALEVLQLLRKGRKLRWSTNRQSIERSELRGTELVELQFAVFAHRTCRKQFVKEAQQHEKSLRRHGEHVIAISAE